MQRDNRESSTAESESWEEAVKEGGLETRACNARHYHPLLKVETLSELTRSREVKRYKGSMSAASGTTHPFETSTTDSDFSRLSHQLVLALRNQLITS